MHENGLLSVSAKAAKGPQKFLESPDIRLITRSMLMSMVAKG